MVELKSWVMFTTVMWFLVASAVSQVMNSAALSGPTMDGQQANVVRIDTKRGCAGVNGTQFSTFLPANLQTCQFQESLRADENRWYTFMIAPESVNNMTVVIDVRVFLGQVQMLLLQPGQRTFLRARSLYSSDGAQELYVAMRAGEMIPGEYRLGIWATLHNPLLDISISTTAVAVQLAAAERQALRSFVDECCTQVATLSPRSFCRALLPSALGPQGLAEATVDLCHYPPNTCNDKGRLTRLILPRAGLQCPRFPRSLAGFTELVTLDISDNMMDDTLAGVGEVVSKLPKLRRLFVMDVGLKGPLECGLIQLQARSLRALALSGNFLEGSLPSCYTISSLGELYLSRNQLTGTLPEFSAGSQLRILFAAGQNKSGGVSGPITSSLATSQITFLNLQRNSLSGPLPSLPTSMVDINLGQNRLEGQLWSKVPVNMLNVDVHDNKLSGTLPSNIATAWPNVTYIAVDNNMLTGNLPVLPAALRQLSVGGNKLGPHILGRTGGRASTGGRRLHQAPGQLVQLPKDLTYLDLANNSFSFDINLVNWSNLVFLAAEHNQLTGKFPVTFFDNLNYIFLGHNRLTGRLDELTWMGDIAELDLANNQLEGGLPASMAKMASLSFLDLSNNKLSGELKEFADALPRNNSLMVFNVSGNQFTGTVPSSLANLSIWRPLAYNDVFGVPAPRVLDLSSNRLTGPFPSFIIQRTPLVLKACECPLIVLTGGGDNRLTCPLPEAVRQAGWSLNMTVLMEDTCIEPNTTKRVTIAYLLDAKEQYVVRDGGSIPTAAAASVGGAARSTMETPEAKKGGPNVGVIVGAVVGAVGGILVLAGLGYLGYKKVYLPHRASKFERFADTNPLGAHPPPAGEQAVNMAALPTVMNGRETV